MKWIYKILLPLIVLAHSSIVLGNLAALVILPFITPWYIALPIMTFVVRMIFDQNPCPATHLENRLRFKANIEQIEGFVWNYTTGPLVKLWNKLRRK